MRITTSMQQHLVDSWAAYNKILQNDYLSHTHLYARLAEMLSGLNGNSTFSMVDLGCGDAHYTAGALQKSGAGARLSLYRGVDLAADALELARANVGVAAAGAAVEVAVQNMLDYAQAGGSPDTFDIALTSFAAHHLTPDEKAIFLKGVLQQLKPGGVLVVCDAYRHDGETRPEYLDRFCNFANGHWTELNPAELKMFEDHMRTHDYMETVQGYQQLASEAGFGEGDILTSDKFGNMKLVAYPKLK
eukprot:CAMPEP_0206137368 /NCGR_PEP_ID=MMETSP1473-20131121/2504_1 /ASSEMBLY_ACC=CAM_ASM_001109 /TAXON_ID=1461547 /ORGANISM="Stichococcus sp, Strain RCC1054" /LENGTH=245 /DNA_ID=CAMNT_0053530415 /DNA_START=73 /DNA_END=811 /DNA_ORIENTATION=-